MFSLYEFCKVDLAVEPHTYAAPITSRYYGLRDYGEATFAVTVAGTVDITEVVNAVVMEAEDGDGTGAQATAYDIDLGSVDADACPGLTSCTIEMLAVDLAETITVSVDGENYVFTAAAAQSLPDREFDQSVDDAGTAASFAACVNDATYGVPGVTAEIIAPATDVVTLYSTEPGEVVFSIEVTDVAETILVPLQYVGYVTVDHGDLDYEDGMTHVAICLTAAAATPDVQAVLVRSKARKLPVDQAVADAYPA